jgi:diguanylate cyclase (GGDEF)-like protein
MARSLDDATVLKMSRLLSLSLKAIWLDDPLTQDPYVRQLASVSGSENELVEPIGEEQIAGFLRVDDIEGRQSLVFRTQLARDLHHEGIVVQRVLFTELFAIVLLGAVAAFWLLQRGVLRPIAALSATAASITGSGDLSARTEITGDDEIGRLGQAFNAMLDELESSRKELLLVQETLEYRVRHDSLTGLLNRNAIVEELIAESARCTREGTTMAVMMADLDHFKRINDEFGHGMGDEALRRASDLIRTSIRPYDRVGRFGGEEFLILAHNISQHDAIHLAERIRRAVSAVALGGASPASATLSIGVTLTAGVTDWHDVVAAADSALYQAKRAGRNRVEFAPLNGASQMLTAGSAASSDPAMLT